MNYPHSTNKLALAVAVASAVFLAGCDTSNEDVQAPPPALANPAYSFQAGVAPLFNPVTRELPLNTDIVFAAAASTDGTAQSGGDSNAVFSALNDLDGFSTTAYFDIAFDGSIDPATLVAAGPGQNVFLLPLNSNGDALDPDNIDSMDPFDLANIPAIEVEVVSLDGGVDNVVRVKPLEPLLAATKYLVFLTNGIKDASGGDTTVGLNYNIIRAPDTSITESLIPVRDAIAGWELLSASFLSAASGGLLDVPTAQSTLTIAFTFTTTDPHRPLIAMAAPRAALVSQGVPSGAVTSLDSILPRPRPRLLDINPLAVTDISPLTEGVLPADVGDLFTGYIELPSYQPVANAASFDPAFLGGNWTADLDLAGALSQSVPSDADGTYNVTYRYPFAEEKSMEAFPLQVTLPDPDVIPSFAGGATCAQWQAGSGNPGYPVVIYVHGITSDRTSVVALAHALAGQCVATVAIDLPVHGVAATSPYKDNLNIERATFASLYASAEPRERHFNIYSDANVPTPMDFDASEGGSGSWFINLGRLQNTRDNLRQGVMDMLNLNASLADIAVLDLDGDADENTPLFDLSKVYVVGISLGGTVGAVFTSVNQQAIAADNAAGFTSDLNPIVGFVASTIASQLTQVIINSQSIGPQIVGGLAANGVLQGTSDFEKFAYVAQSTVDSGDPVNFAESLAAVGVPTLVQQVVGGGAAALGEDAPVSCDGVDIELHTSDKVVPNSVVGAPLAGTTPFAVLAGASQRASGAADLSAENGLVNLTIGHHASLLRPQECGSLASTSGEQLATGELQTQVVSFVLSGLSGGSTAQVGTAGGGAAGAFIQAPAP